ncbi:WD repeat-containing protein 3-like [Uloborus diversus]|uniref:WD repeat-containing protein 3-like n=1 Tax=Uloborus diversus TaxID=327109 RepID=UPI00240A4D23|nr:WD repeat-containing protein 3-like [Uloborus diversus]
MTTRQYLRFCHESTFGLIASATAGIQQINVAKNLKNVVAVPACENVYLWNLHTKEKVFSLAGETSFVTCLVSDSNDKYIAVGYADGVVRIFNLQSKSCIISFSGHKSAVSCLAFEKNGSNLVSGGKDSEIVVWNVTDQAGLFRLKGHKGPISKCHIFEAKNILISSSKDTYIKFWDLDTQHCFQTLIGNRNEILDFVIIKDTRLITGINGPDLKVWDLFLLKEEVNAAKKPRRENSVPINDKDSSNFPEDEVEENPEDRFQYTQVGTLLTTGDKTVSLCVDENERLLGCHASTKILQLYKILNSEEISKKFRKRKRKESKIQRENENSEEVDISVSLVDEFQALQSIRMDGKIDSFSTYVKNDDTAIIAALLKNNSIVQYMLDIKSKDSTAVLSHSISLSGHRSIVRTLSYSTDNLSVLSAAEESVKVWRTFQEEKKCTNTMSSNFALSSVFVTGNSHCIIGTKNGKLEIFEINANLLLESISAHTGSINSISLSPDQDKIASAGSDKDVKFWDFELISDEQYSSFKKRLSLTLKRTLKMPDEILCLKYSPDKKKIAISLLDNTVQVLFEDTLKLVFSLYGHVLPVTCMDISSDGTLIVTGSEDKDIRIWSMEFGSCNKFIKRAHDKGITCLQFLPKTHLFFTGGRDNMIKQWDADNFQKITTLKGHQNEITAMAVSPDGKRIVTSSRDKSIRLWEKTAEPLVLEEEQEKEREEEDEAEDLPVIPGETNKEVALPGIKTAETIKSVDQLIEAIDIYKSEVLKLKEHELECKSTGKQLPAPLPHPLLLAFSTKCPIKYMRKVVNKIKSSELEGTLLYLPFNYVLDFLRIICEFVERSWDTELCERCASFLVRIHFGQILSAQHFQPVIEKLKENLFSQVYHTRDMIGFAKVASHLQLRAIDAQEEVPLFTSVLNGLQEKKKKSKKKLSRPIVAFT